MNKSAALNYNTNFHRKLKEEAKNLDIDTILRGTGSIKVGKTTKLAPPTPDPTTIGPPTISFGDPQNQSYGAQAASHLHSDFKSSAKVQREDSSQLGFHQTNTDFRRSIQTT